MRRTLVKILFIILIAFSWCAGSQTYAHFMGYADFLGTPIYGSFYNPINWAVWMWYYDVEYYSLFVFLGSSLVSIFITKLILDKLKSIGDTYGSSRWMSEKEIKKEGFFQNSGVVLAQKSDAKIKSKVDQKKGRTVWNYVKESKLIIDNSEAHTLIIGPTGRGKGVSFVIPTLLSWKESCIVYDIKKENWELTSGWRKKISIPVRFEPSADYSAKWNPLYEIEPGPTEISMAQNISEIVCVGNEKEAGSHWTESAKQLLTGMILYVLHMEEGENRSLGGIYRFFNDPDSDLVGVLEKMKLAENCGLATDVIRQSASAMLNKPENERGSIASSVIRYLGLFADPIVSRNTSSSDFSVLDLVQNEYPISLYICVNPNDADRIKPLTRMLFEFTGKRLMTMNGIKKNRILMLIDEFPTLGHMEFFETQLAVFRSYGVKCAFICQSFEQLFKHYTKNTSIPSNCRTKLVLGCDSPEDAETVTKYLGQQTLEKTTESRSGSLSGVFMTNRSESHSEVGRTLLTADEVMRLRFDQSIILIGSSYPYLGKKVMWYQDSRFRRKGGIWTLEKPQDDDLENNYENQQTAIDLIRYLNPWDSSEHKGEMNNEDKSSEGVVEDIPKELPDNTQKEKNDPESIDDLIAIKDTKRVSLEGM